MAETNQTIDVANLIETQKVNWFRISIFIWAGLVLAFEGYDMQVLAYAAPSIIKAWHVNKATFGQVIGLGLFGYMLGATVLGLFVDRFVLKKMIVCGCLIFGAFTFATGYANTLHGAYRSAVYRGDLALASPFQIQSLSRRSMLPRVCAPRRLESCSSAITLAVR